MSKLERLLNLTAALLDTAVPLTAEELRRRIEGYPDADASFRRAFERDKDDLRSMGVPVALEPIPGTQPPQDGYRIHRAAYEGRAPRLEPDELAALHLAASLVRLEGVGEDEEAFWKLGGAPVGPRPDAGGADPVADLPSDPNLALLFEAAASGQWVHFGYRGEARTCYPRRVSFVRGHWYLSAYDEGRDDERLFRLDRLEDEADLVPDRTDRPPPPETPRDPAGIRGWSIGDADPVLVTLAVDADQAAWARHEVGEGSVVERRADGSIVIELEVRNETALFGFVVTFLDHAEILAPADLRGRFVELIGAKAS